MTKKHEWKFFSFVRQIRQSCSLHYGRFRVTILIILSILKRILVLLVTRILILVVLVIVQKFVLTWSGAPIIIPSMVAPSTTVYFFRNIEKSAIKPMTNLHEWKSVPF